MKLENAKKFAKTATPENAKVAMRDAGVDWKERPDDKMLKNHRSHKEKKRKAQSYSDH